MPHLAARVDPDLLNWVATEAQRDHRSRSQMAGVLLIEARQARQATRADRQHGGHPTIPGQTTIDGAP